MTHVGRRRRRRGSATRWYAPGDLPVLELGLGDRGAEVDVPQRRGLGLVRLAAGEVAQERALRRPLRARSPIGRVRHATSRPTARAAARAPRTSARPRRRGVSHSSTKLRPRDRDRLLAGLLGRLERPGRTAATGRSARRSSSAPDARSAARCRPSPSGRRPRARASAGSGRSCRSATYPNTEPMCSEPLTVGGGVSIEKISARVFDAVEAVGAVGLPARGPLLLEPVERRLLRDRHRNRSLDATRACRRYAVRRSFPCRR